MLAYVLPLAEPPFLIGIGWVGVSLRAKKKRLHNANRNEQFTWTLSVSWSWDLLFFTEITASKF